MTTLVSFVSHSMADRAELAVHGEIDASNTAALHDAISDVVRGGRTCVVDLSQTSYLDSAGINTLFRVHRHLDQLGIRLHLVAPVGSCARYALNLVCAHRIIPIHDAADAARAALEVPSAT
ncbi:hypothetical protein Misp01_34090 [Microtetraspora sp. NBRC 13810]|uniref:STAS domain-containing protein n=1 Tax=Microtetraspora sp. NBRC 13810 TaxID=3030990 RepID=UPI0024A5F105|nr:STAS domain-containing protein [Microtetraspora sp. NBRC 13810]GLW08279.1 hypothetical protein Misp01_34090 [Microtetraspora sp. NBRC 13810]